MHLTTDLGDMHRYLVSNRTPNLVATTEPFLIYGLVTHFDKLHTARATRLADTSNEANPVAVLWN